RRRRLEVETRKNRETDPCLHGWTDASVTRSGRHAFPSSRSPPSARAFPCGRDAVRVDWRCGGGFSDRSAVDRAHTARLSRVDVEQTARALSLDHYQARDAARD